MRTAEVDKLQEDSFSNQSAEDWLVMGAAVG